MSGRPRRSTLLLVAAGVVAVGLGLLAARALRPPPPPPAHRLVFRDSEPPPEVDLRAVQERMLERLVEQARVEPNPARLPALGSLALTVARAPRASAWMLERLGESDVPPGLLTAFVRALPAGAELDSVLDPVLLERLQGDGGAGALELLRGRGRTREVVEAGCGCVWGVVPKRGAGARLFLLAEGGVAWEPALRDGVWTLGLRPEGGGPSLRVLEVEGPAEALRVRARAGEAARIGPPERPQNAGSTAR